MVSCCCSVVALGSADAVDGFDEADGTAGGDDRCLHLSAHSVHC